MFWKKCDPCEGATSKSAKLASTITRAPEIWSHFTGMPSQGSRVPQRPTLVRGTLEDNLRLGNPGATDAEVVRALERSGLDGLVARLPIGLATPVGEGGLTLSAGERQRIAIGRAVLRDVPVVLLDEPTAHLDADREDSLRTRLEPWLEGRTVVVAAHRGGLVARVDRTVTLVAGRLVDATAAGSAAVGPLRSGAPR